MNKSVEENQELSEIEAIETHEWLESLEYVLRERDPEYVRRLLKRLERHARQAGVEPPSAVSTPYTNTIPAKAQPTFPGDQEIERRIKSIVRWNAMAMVVRANKELSRPQKVS